MDADWSVELGAEDPALEFPWSASDDSVRYVDLRQRPEAIREIPEAARYPELGEFLLIVNAPSDKWLTAKCDVWVDDELGEAESIYDATLKHGCYVDLIACDSGTRFSFERHERWVISAALALSGENEHAVACELIVRRCWYQNDSDNSRSGFYITLYLFGYGHSEAEAHIHWAAGLRQLAPLLSASAP